MAVLPISAKGATARRRSKVLVGPVDLTIEGAGITIVMGPNGAGKTSLLKLLHGIERLRGGHLHYGCALAEARAKQAFVFQTPVMMRRSVVENIAYPLRLAGIKRADARMRAYTWATRIGLGEAAERAALGLSGGERQKLALARALIRAPEVLFLDEPCAALDGRATREIEALLSEAVAAGTRLIMSTHDMGQARRLADEVVFLHKGRIEEATTATTFFERPASEAAQAFVRGDIVE
ncbi:ATP-binding cassette domain-containing protein [Epibacterium ulvae]|uniref:ATP-binding cassette domain-containing protein n=1 Tax=Epibacterium ulvae TaxID=1156985 RepID=UPI002490E762|nr:ATP-binding cassette domain-containing protein [Epibacterium ulvae]